MSDELFNVVTYFPDGTYDYARRYVPVKEAFEGFIGQTRSVGARIGTSVRVIITDGGDSICAEWLVDKGFTFPPELVGKRPEDAKL